MQHLQVFLLNENFRLTLGKNYKQFNVLFMFRYGFVSTSFVRYPHECDEHCLVKKKLFIDKEFANDSSNNYVMLKCIDM